MTHIKRIFSYCLLIELLLVANAFAQSPNPPAGWQYVRNLDSLKIYNFHASGDTIFMIGYDAHESLKSYFQIVSLNGGKDWDSVMLPRPIFHWDTYPHEASICLINYVGDSLIFYTSSDGKHFDSVQIGRDTSYNLGQYDKFFIDPHDRNHWLYIGTGGVGPSLGSGLSQSFNAGHTWQPVRVPIAPAQKLYLELVFDIRRSGVWYVHVIAQGHLGFQDTSFVVRTTDNGQTFHGVKQWGTHYGIGAPGEVRRWWGYSNVALYGPEIGNEDDDVLLKYNWLLAFHPSLPLVEKKNGYQRWLNDGIEQFPGNSIYMPSNYHVFYSSPLTATIAEREIIWDTTSNKYKYAHCWVHQTEDDWKTWNTIWESQPFEWVELTYLDEKTPSLWAVTKFLTDTALPGNNPDRYTSYLYRRSLKLSVPFEKKIPNIFLIAFPTPSTGIVKVRMPSESSHVLSLVLCDVNGRNISELSNDFYFSQGIIEWTVPEQIPSGFYFLKIRTENSTYLVKIVLQR